MPSAALPQPAALPGLVDFAAWSQTGEGGFKARYAALLDGAAAETAKGRGAPMTARLALARFLVGSELSFEAIGVLNTLVKLDPTLAADPEFRGLRGAARVMAGRYKDAQADFSSPVTASDPASSLWRGYAAAKVGDMTGARAQFAAGEPALGRFAPAWRARFALADADAALAAGDVPAARRLVAAASAAGPQGNDALAVQLASARVAEASGHPDQALPLYEAVSKSAYGALSAPATLKVVQIRLAQGRDAGDRGRRHAGLPALPLAGRRGGAADHPGARRAEPAAGPLPRGAGGAPLGRHAPARPARVRWPCRPTSPPPSRRCS